MRRTVGETLGLTILLAIAAVPAMAADCTGAPGDCTEIRFQHGGLQRLYQYHVPPSGTCTGSAFPVVMFLHGGGGSANGARHDIGYDASNRNCFVQVFAQGAPIPSGNIWNAGDCLGLPPGSGYTGPTTAPGCALFEAARTVDDLGYIRRVLDDLAIRVAIDRRRIYLSGFSQGAAMVHRLMCEMSERFAAAAVLEGTLKIAQCAPARAVPLIQWAALGDLRVPFNGGSEDTSVPYTLGVHLAVHQIPADPPPPQIRTSVTIPSITDQVRTWTGGRDGSSIVLHLLSEDADHTWLFEQPAAFDWQQTNWEFLRQYSLPAGRRRPIH